MNSFRPSDMRQLTNIIGSDTGFYAYSDTKLSMA